MDWHQILKEAPFYIAAGLGFGIVPYVYFNYIAPPTEEELASNRQKSRPQRLMERIGEEPGLKDLEPALIDPAKYKRVIGFLWFGYTKNLEKDGLTSDQIGCLIRLREPYVENRYRRTARREARISFFSDNNVVRPYLLIVNPTQIEGTKIMNRDDLTARLT